MDIQGVAELARLWEAAPDITREELSRTMTEAGLLLKREVKERTPVATGTLRKSITSRQRVLAGNVIGVVGSPLNYAVSVELGTRPHFPPVAPLKDWVKQKLDLPSKQAGAVAHAIVRTIGMRGTKGTHMFRDAFAANREQIARLFEAARTRIVARLGEGSA